MRHTGFAFLFFAGALAATALNAQPGLMGHNVNFQVLTYDDPTRPIFEGAAHRTRITEGIEFGLGREGAQNDVDVVPILIDISATRIELRYSIADPGALWTAGFNGYVLTFDAGCTLIERARVDPDFTNLPFDNKRVIVDGNTLRLNVSAQKYDRDSRIGIDLSVADCPVS